MGCFKIVLLVMVLLLPACPGTAKLYKYQKDGVWHYTDTPARDQIEKSEEMAESGPNAMPPSKAGTAILKDHVWRNPIEKAAAATVAIKTSMGYGSGFFISGSGHIITNKHVIRPSAKQNRTAGNYFKKIDKNIKRTRKGLEKEEKRLEKFNQKIAESKHRSETDRDPARRQYYKDQYEHRKEQYKMRKERLEKRKKELEYRKKQNDKVRGEYNYRSSVAKLSRSFTITLVDDTELHVRLLAASKEQDLALLKLDGYKTPWLRPGIPARLAQGDPVYAIGNPAKLRNTVTSGIFSGFEDTLIQTNAQINPGNSGGPLIDPQGNVLGINTKKIVGRTLEGLGFAIPIQTALSEFHHYLP
jgi:hypothetical protein